MKIKTHVYEGLKPMERVIATIEANARGDAPEFERLINTCPKENYFHADPVYTDNLRILITLSSAVECDLRGNLIGVLLAMISKKDDAILKFSENISSILSAWHETLNSYGVRSLSMDKFGVQTHATLKEIREFLPDPNKELLAYYKEVLENCLAKAS